MAPLQRAPGQELRSAEQAYLHICERIDAPAGGRFGGEALDSVAAEAFDCVFADCISGVQLDYETRAQTLLPTGSRAIDALLAGGLRAGEVVELCGPPASGKTQLCLSAAAAVALSGKHVVVVDTTGGFNASRLAQLLGALASGHALSQEVQRRTLDSVRCARVFDVHAALRLVDELRGGGHTSGPAQPPVVPALLVVDSVSALLSPLLTTKHAQGHALMLSLVGALRALAQDLGIAVLVTNHTVSGRDGDTGSLKPALGETWKSQPHMRVQFTQGAQADGVSELGQVHYAHITLGRGRGRHCSYMLEAAGLVPLRRDVTR